MESQREGVKEIAPLLVQGGKVGTDRAKGIGAVSGPEAAGCQWRSKTAEIWRHRKSGHENCRPGAGSRAGASPAQQTLDAAEGRIRWGMAVSAAVPRLQPC